MQGQSDIVFDQLIFLVTGTIVAQQNIGHGEGKGQVAATTDTNLNQFESWDKSQRPNFSPCGHKNINSTRYVVDTN